ncbi:MAG: alpha-ketoglutarate-dependent dioxygenase AlkB, partial [Actinomycetota bacterium]|nr:alpha-ketoglutarate-dependent dioxygenase AlkB [Actinomycetota bacterium]
LPGADLTLHKSVWVQPDGDLLCQQLVEELEWSQDKISMFGQVHNVPRLNAWYGDPNCSYSWSGIQMNPTEWTPTLSSIRERVIELAGEEFNSVLANLYRDGSDKVDWHADDEQVLGLTPVIASVSFGASRKFRLRRKDRSLKATDIVLDSGDVLIMRGSTQQLWEHEVPRSKKVKEPRVNLTFRKVRVAA